MPLASVALVLDDGGGCGGGWVVTSQRGDDGPFRNEGWAASCRPGRLLVFDGALLHGVAPGRPSRRWRTTLMLSFWGEGFAVDALARAETEPRAAQRPVMDLESVSC